MFVGEGAEALGFDQQGASGFDGERGESGGGPGFEGEGSDDRHVEAEILVGFGDFDRDGLSATHEGTTFDCVVGSFEAFDGEDGAIADDDSLSDVEAADFFGDAQAENDVFVRAAARFGSGKVAFRGKEFVEVGGGGEEFDPVLGQCVSHGAEEGFGVAFFELGEEEEGGEVGAEVEKVFRRDLPGHHGVAGAGFLGVSNELAELAHAEPAKVIHFGREVWVRLTLEGCGAKALDPGPAGRGGELERIASVAGNDEKGFGRGRAHRVEFSGGARITARVFSVQCSVFSRTEVRFLGAPFSKAASAAAFAFQRVPELAEA